MQRHRVDVRLVTFDFGELAIDVIAHPNREVKVHDEHDRRDCDEQPNPGTFPDRFHFLTSTTPNASECFVKQERIGREDWLCATASVSRLEMRRSRTARWPAKLMRKAWATDSVSATPSALELVLPLVSGLASAECSSNGESARRRRRSLQRAFRSARSVCRNRADRRAARPCREKSHRSL